MATFISSESVRVPPDVSVKKSPVFPVPRCTGSSPLKKVVAVPVAMDDPTKQKLVSGIELVKLTLYRPVFTSVILDTFPLSRIDTVPVPSKLTQARQA